MTTPAEVLPLWDRPAPHSHPEDDFTPVLERYPVPGTAARGAVLICPGGGYGGRADHEGAPVAQRFNAAGFHAAVIQYRVSPHRHPAPLLDASRAVRLARHHAAAWHIRPDRIALLGFSAGGHLAASVGVHGNRPEARTADPLGDGNGRPDALVLCYPVISAGPCAHRGSFENLLGPDPAADALRRLSLEDQVSTETPPTFLWHTADDGGVPVQNALLFAAALDRHNIPFELHVYAQGRHGLGLAEDDPQVGTWSALAAGWLERRDWGAAPGTV